MRDTSERASGTCYYASDWPACKGSVTMLVGLQMQSSIDAHRNCLSVVDKHRSIDISNQPLGLISTQFPQHHAAVSTCASSTRHTTLRVPRHGQSLDITASPSANSRCLCTMSLSQLGCKQPTGSGSAAQNLGFTNPILCAQSCWSCCWLRRMSWTWWEPWNMTQSWPLGRTTEHSCVSTSSSKRCAP